MKTLEFKDGALHLLDQRLLPGQVTYAVARTSSETAAAIRAMAVRGAPAIGCAAAYGLALAAKEAAAASDPDATFAQAVRELREARPTGLSAKRTDLLRQGATHDAIAQALLQEADAVTQEDLEACRAIGRFGKDLVPEGRGILTHCNAGGLATAGYGTALGVVRAALAAGKSCAVYADETRPWLQGARLTAWELLQDGIPVTLLPDVAAASLLASGKIGCVVVGADRIARNGDTANKVGTYPLALAAQAASVPFFVAAPISTVDLRARDARDIPIEERSADEVTHLAGTRIAAEGASVFNPAFDVTPARLIAAIVTERGVARPPYEEALSRLVLESGRAP
ncbi:MAG: S-methyl-5-thioribose-1-phosphate isomerase [Deltaproteobacteria bacterium]|nr:MAG: S-methyl-5-thioribose-1-phosphate isomerase [Deltaproteobacteria bacterium]